MASGCKEKPDSVFSRAAACSSARTAAVDRVSRHLVLWRALLLAAALWTFPLAGWSMPSADSRGEQPIARRSGIKSVSIVTRCSWRVIRTFPVYSFELLHRLENLSLLSRDNVGGCAWREWFDIYFSDKEGKPNPLGEYVAIDYLSSPSRQTAPGPAGGHIAQVSLDFANGVKAVANRIVSSQCRTPEGISAKLSNAADGSIDTWSELSACKDSRPQVVLAFSSQNASLAGNGSENFAQPNSMRGEVLAQRHSPYFAFSRQKIPAVQFSAKSAAVFDFDKDGLEDVLLTNEGNSDLWLLRSQQAGFQAMRLSSLPAQDCVGPWVIEADGDGRPDALFFCGTVAWVYRQAAASFERWKIMSIASQLRQVLASDFDGDGLDELVLISQKDGQLDIFTSKPKTKEFERVFTRAGVQGGAIPLYANSDNHPDLGFFHQSNSILEVFYGGSKQNVNYRTWNIFPQGFSGPVPRLHFAAAYKVKPHSPGPEGAVLELQDKQFFFVPTTELGLHPAFAWLQLSSSHRWGPPIYGDFDGDSLTDFALRPFGGRFWHLFLSREELPKEVLALEEFNEGPEHHVVIAGDFNGDGRDDAAQFLTDRAEHFGPSAGASGAALLIAYSQLDRDSRASPDYLTSADDAHGQGEGRRQPESSASPCIGLNRRSSKLWGMLWGGTCPANHAVYAVSEMKGGSAPEQIPSVMLCCPLPAEDVLLEETDLVERECPDGSVMVGEEWLADPESGKSLYQMRCRKINRKRYQLGEQRPGRYWGTGHSGRNRPNSLLRTEIPLALRRGIGRSGLENWEGDGCLGYPFGSMLTAKGVNPCESYKFRQLQYAGAPGDPEKGTAVQMLPPCERLTDVFRPDARCLTDSGASLLQKPESTTVRSSN